LQRLVSRFILPRLRIVGSRVFDVVGCSLIARRSSSLMSLFFLFLSIHSACWSTIPILFTTKAFDPRSAICHEVYEAFDQRHDDDDVATPKMIPSRVRKIRSLCAKSR